MQQLPVAMTTIAPVANERKCLSCMPYRAAVITIASLTMVASICDIVFGAVGGCINYYSDYNYHSHYVWFAWTSIGQGVFGFIMSILLLVGILNKTHGLLLTYMIGEIVNGCGYFCNGAVMLTQYWYYGNPIYYGVWAMLWSIMLFYFVTVVASFRASMMQQQAVGVMQPYPQFHQAMHNQGFMMQPGTVFYQPGLPTVSGQIVNNQNTQLGTYQPVQPFQQAGGTVMSNGSQMLQGGQQSLMNTKPI